ncbi:MAG: PIN domain-containing protein [Bacteroidales bacterium]|jgi:predicted nucleic acid-binding protein|nr:PIN domain-containing protein [Bacteroidales bacterium]
MANKQTYGVLLDTSFLIRLLSVSDPLHGNALDYYKYFLDNSIAMYVSTISISEYCVKGEVSELPLVSMKIIPFNFHHATKAGKIACALYKARNNGDFPVKDRLIIPNDSNLFAQATIENDIKYFVTSDVKAADVIKKISEREPISFNHLDINIPCNSSFGKLF